MSLAAPPAFPTAFPFSLVHSAFAPTAATPVAPADPAAVARALELASLYPSPTSTYSVSPFFLPTQGASADASPYALAIDAAKATYQAQLAQVHAQQAQQSQQAQQVQQAPVQQVQQTPAPVIAHPIALAPQVQAQTPAQPLLDFRWHEHHCDPAAELVLVAVDGVCFRASRWLMARTSTMIHELSPEHSLAPIPTPATSATLHLYLSACQTAFPVPATVPASTLVALFQLARFLRSEPVGALALAALHARAVLEPWAVFVFAAGHGDVPLARDALRFMGTAPHACPLDRLGAPELDLADLFGVPAGFLKEAMRLRLAPSEGDGDDDCLGGIGGFGAAGYRFRDWAYVAEHFDPLGTRQATNASGTGVWAA